MSAARAIGASTTRPADQARVAVVVPCHNDGATLPETLASVRGQECELVVVDDGSTDARTLAALDEARAAGVRVIRQAQRGVAAARMTGVHATTAPYVFPLDADDRAAAGALAALADALDANPDAAVAWGDVELFGIRNKLGKSYETLDPWLITYQNVVPVMSAIRRDALLAVGGWRSGIAYEDWDLWMALAERGWKGIRIPRKTAYYRVHSPRRWAQSKTRFDETVAELRAVHEPLFAARAANRRRSPAPRRLKVILPLVERLPFVSPVWTWRISALLRHPLATLAAASQRRLASYGRRSRQ